MFTRPPLPRPASIQLARAPVARNARTLQDQAQQDLARLLKQLNIPRGKVPSRPVPQVPDAPAATAPPISRVPPRSVPTSASEASRSPSANARFATALQARPSELHALKTVVAIVTGMAAVALAVSSIGFTVLSGGMTRAEHTLKTHEVRLGEIQSRQDSLKREVETRLANMQALLAEVKYPPSEFGQAQDLFHAGRYVDAEAAYTAFLLRNPNSRVADVALNNAAVASAMHNNCSMTAAYVKRLKTQFPASPFNAALASLVPTCQRLRVASLADTAARPAR